MPDRFNECLQHLELMVGLCQIPKDCWSPDDRRMLNEARGFITHNRETELESQRTQTGGEVVGGPQGRQDGSEAAEEVRRARDSLAEGPEDPS